MRDNSANINYDIIGRRKVQILYWARVNSQTNMIEEVIPERTDIRQFDIYNKPVLLTREEAEQINNPNRR